MTAPASVPAAVAPSTSDSVQILVKPQLGPYKPATGSSVNPVLPRSDAHVPNPQPGYGHAISEGGPPSSAYAAPSVPGMSGVLFKAPPIDPHYQDQVEVVSPYAKVNNPPTQGRWQWLKQFQNHIGLGTQNTTMTGFRNLGDQQRESYMRPALPPRGSNADQWYVPQQIPQAPRTQQFIPTLGTDPYGTGVLNADTLGAGQTAGGVGGSNYTPPANPPVTQPAVAPDSSGMPTWG